MEQPYKTLAQHDAEYHATFNTRNKDGQIRLWRLLKRMVDIAVAPLEGIIHTTEEQFRQRLQHEVDEQIRMWQQLSLVRYTRLSGSGVRITVIKQSALPELAIDDILKCLSYGSLNGNFIHVDDKVLSDYVLDDMPSEEFIQFVKGLYEN